MPLQKQVIDLPLAKGLGQKADPRLLAVGSMTTLTNCVQDKSGSLLKRPGTVDLGVSTKSPQGRSLNPATNGNYDCRLIPGPVGGVAQINNTRLWVRGSLLGADTKAYDLDDVTSVLAQRYGIEVGPKATAVFDMATDGNRLLVVWLALQPSGNNLAMYALFDLTTLAPLVTPQKVPNLGSTAPNFVRLSSYVLGSPSDTCAVVWQVGTNLSGQTFTFSTQTWSALTANFVTNCNQTTSPGTVSGIYDVSLIDASHAAVAYGTTANPPVATVSAYPLSTWVSSSTNNVTPPGATGLHLHGISCLVMSGGSTWVAYSVSGGSTNAQRAFAAHTSAMATTDVADTALWSETSTRIYRLGIIGNPVGVANGVIVVGSAVDVTSAPSSTSVLNWCNFTTSGTVLSLTSRAGLCLASKPFVLTGKNCALACYEWGDPTASNLTVKRTYYALELRVGQLAVADFDARPLATIAPRIVNATACQGLLLPSALFSTDGKRCLTLGTTLRSASGGEGVDLIDIKYTGALWQPAKLGGVTYLSGGVPCAFDGQRVTELGFLYQPPSLGVSVASTTGGGVGPGSGSYTYTYSAVYEWIDATGQRCQSRPTSATVTVTTSTSQISLTVPPMNLTLRQDFESSYIPQIAVAIYRDTSTSPGNQVRIFSADVPVALVNGFATASLTYTDTAADSLIASNEALYTSGGTYDCVCPSSLSCLITHNERLAGVGDDAATIWMSTEYDGGTTQPYFNDALVITLGEAAPITALWSQDGQLFASSRDAIFAISGDGPATNGAGNSWGQPQKLGGISLGCSTDWRSVVQFGAGTVFQHGTKLYLLSRSLEVSYFSQAIEDTLAANPVVTSATHYAQRNELRFTLKASETASTGTVANYNYVTDTWSLFSYYDQDAVAFGADVDSSIVVADTWYHANMSGRVWSESSQSQGWDVDNAFLTSPNIGVNTHWVTMTAASAWAKAGGVQGFGRFWDAMVMVQSVSACDVTVSVGNDYADAFTDVRLFTALAISGFSTPQPQMKVDLTHQKGEAVRVQFSDAPPTGVSQTSGSGANLLSFSISVGAKGGRMRVPATQGA